jgi:hypothetical protein
MQRRVRLQPVRRRAGPWALRKTDPERMETVLPRCSSASAIWPWRLLRLCRPRTKLLDQMGIPADARDLPRLAAIGTPALAERLPVGSRQSACFPGSNCRRRASLMLIDSHCHLEYKGLVEDQQGVLEARARGRNWRFPEHLHPQREWDQVIATAEREADVWASVGIHPHEADAHADLGEAALLLGGKHPKVIAIGETGLDYYYDHSDRAVQQACSARTSPSRAKPACR